MKKIISLVKLAFFIAILISMLAVVTAICSNKNSEEYWGDFFESPTNPDILFAGNSHMMDAVSMMQLWKDYGYSAYNIATPDSTMPNTYWTIINALDYCNPKLIVLDCYYLNEDARYSPNTFANMHGTWDAVPFSLNKIKAISDLLADPVAAQRLAARGEAETPSKLALFWGFTTYHNRWNNLTIEDFKQKSNLEQGSRVELVYSAPDYYDKVEYTEPLEYDTAGVEYLRKLISECKDRDIELLLTFIPFPAQEGSLRSANTMTKIAGESGIKSINFLQMDTVNYRTDCVDPAGHLNGFAMEKITSYLGNYISDNYDIDTHTGDSAYSSLDVKYEKYVDSFKESLYTQESLITYLMSVKYSKATTTIEINDRALFNDPFYVEMFGNMNVDTSLLGPETYSITIWNGGEKTEVSNRTEGARNITELVEDSTEETGDVVQEGQPRIRVAIFDPESEGPEYREFTW